jgi:membrane protease YdiL (CAAX protease family)
MAPKNLDFMARLFMIVVCAWLWVFVRPVPQLGYRFTFSWRALRAALMNFLLFAAIAIPLSLGLRFSRWNPEWPGIGRFCLEYVEIFVFIGWLEELLFRGFLQTLLSERIKSERWGQGVTSCIFGLSHILHAPVPNWRYVLLASIAGWFYGRAFRQGGWLTASAMTHALVDTVWRTFFWRG